MVSFTDLKFYKSKNAGLGGDIDTDLLITSSIANNLFQNVPRSEQVAGEDYYMCMYMKDTSSEKMGDLAFWLSSDTIKSDTEVKWAKEVNYHKYQYAPWKDFNGTSDFTEEAHRAALSVGKFSISAWVNFTGDLLSLKMIVGKGVDLGGSSADYWNYQLYVNSSEQLVCGFQEMDGTNHLATSPLSYNDGKWHFVTVTYDGLTVRLYVDAVQVATHATSATPNTNTRPVRIGCDSVGTSGTFFTGKIDEVRIWDIELTADEILNLYNTDEIPKVDSDNLLNEYKYGNDNGSRIAQEIADQYTAPVGITDWKQVTSTEPTGDAIMGTFRQNTYKPVWVWWHVDAGAEDVRKDRAIFSAAMTITSTGTGTGGQTGGGGGTGSGGNPTPTPTNYKIAVVGDWGEENETDDVVNQIKNGGYNLVIGTGDNSYTGSDNEWYPIVKSIDHNQGSSIRFETCMGNHDSESNIKSHFRYRNIYTSFDFENTHTLILSTENNMDIGSAQHTFATNDLKAQDSRSNIDWIFVVFHRPMMGASSDHPNNEMDQIQNYMDLFLQHNVTMVFAAHNHNWQRTYPVKRSGSGVTRVITDSNGPYTPGTPSKWLIHVISGAGGHDRPGTLYDLGSKPSFQVFQSNDHNGIFSITASNGGQTLTCKFINTGGDEFDTFTITAAT